VKSLNLGLAFVLELCLLAALAYWGFQLDTATAVRVVVVIAAPAALALIWSRFAAPTAKRRLRQAPLVAFKVAVFTLGAALLYSTGQHWPAILLEAAALVNLGLAVVWDQSAPLPRP
jgi:hypothetical protein